MSPPEPAARYAAELLGMNPLDQAGSILARRAAFLSGGAPSPSPTVAADTDYADDRERASEAVSCMVSEFWSRDASDVERELAALELKDFPDLAATARRLTGVLRARPSFDRLSNEPKVYGRLVDELKKVVVVPLREAADLQAKAERRFLTDQDVKLARRTVALIRKRYPPVYELAPDWLERVEKLKQERALARQLVTSSWWWGGIVIWLLIKLIQLIARD